MEFNNLSRNLNKLIVDARISTRILEEKLNIPIATIKKIRYGNNLNPTISTLLPIANYFGITVNQLIGEVVPQSSIAKIDPTENVELRSVPVPVLDWENLNEDLASKIATAKKYVASEFITNNSLFALAVDSEDYMMFEKSGILIIDADRKFAHQDYVVVYKMGQSRPTIKKIILDDDIGYLQSLINGISSSIQLTPEYKIIGVVVAYKKSFV